MGAEPAACDAAIDQMDVGELSAEDFQREYLGRQRPVLLRGATAGWGAARHWRRSAFLRRYGHLRVQVGGATDLVLFNGGWHKQPPRQRVSLAAFVASFDERRAAAAGGDRPFIFDSSELLGSSAELRADFSTPAALRPAFRTASEGREEAEPSMWNVLSIGEDGAGLPFHSHGDAWLGLVHGSKRWFLYAPGEFDEVDRNRTSPHQPVSDWAETVLPHVASKPIQCTQRAGEVLFVPASWLHATLNVGETLAVGGQIEWAAEQRESTGHRVLRDRPRDFQAHKDVAVAIGNQLQVPQRSQAVIKEAFVDGALRHPRLQDEEGGVSDRAVEAAEHFEAAMALLPTDITLHKMAADLRIAAGGEHKRLLSYVEDMSDVLESSVPPSIAAAGMSSVMDYAMVASTLAKIEGEWAVAVSALELAARLHPDDQGVQRGLSEARAAAKFDDDASVDRLTIDANARAEQRLDKFWQASVGSGHARLGLRSDWQQQLKALHDDTGIHGVRFHGSFDDDMGPVVGLGPSGALVYNFTLLDKLYDGILRAGVRPIVELSFMPRAIANCTTKCRTRMHYSALEETPRTPQLWADLVGAFVRHLVARHGLDEILRWRFEVWNEMWGISWGNGSTGRAADSPYMSLFNASWHAIKAVSPRLSVGGPATAHLGRVAEFAAAREAWGIPNTTADFISTHTCKLNQRGRALR